MGGKLHARPRIGCARNTGSRVCAYSGHFLHPSHFDSRSDIDLAVEGLDVGSYWAAVAELYFFDKEISIELVEPRSCPDAVWSAVELEGVDV